MRRRMQWRASATHPARRAFVAAEPGACGSWCARPLDVHRSRAMRARAVPELAIEVVAPAERLAGRRDAAVVRPERPERDERVATRDTHRNAAIRVAVVAELTVDVAPPAPRIAARRERAAVHRSGGDAGEAVAPAHTYRHRA